MSGQSSFFYVHCGACRYKGSDLASSEVICSDLLLSARFREAKKPAVPHGEQRGPSLLDAIGNRSFVPRVPSVLNNRLVSLCKWLFTLGIHYKGHAVSSGPVWVEMR